MEENEYEGDFAVGELYIDYEPEQVSLNEITALLYYVNGIAEGLSDSEVVAEIGREFAYNEEVRKEAVGDEQIRERIIGKLANNGDLKTITSSKGRYLSNQRSGAVKVRKIRKESPFLLEIFGPKILVFVVLYLGSGISYEYEEVVDEDGNSKVKKRFEFNPPNLSDSVEALRMLF